MPSGEEQRKTCPSTYTYEVGHIRFTVNPVYRTDKGEPMFDILLKLMKTETERTQ